MTRGQFLRELQNVRAENAALKEENKALKATIRSMQAKEVHEQVDSKLAVITTFYNPMNYVNLRSNYLRFSEEIKKHATLFPIELSFDGNFFIEDENVIQIRGEEGNILWQKERLLSIALENLPKEYTNVAWLDCDILFQNQNWANEINEKLKRHLVVQVFETVDRLDENGNVGIQSTGIIKLNHEKRTIHNKMFGTTGFGWAARRSVLDSLGFLDTQIVGGADALMYFSFYGIEETHIHLQLNRKWKEVVYEWARRAHATIAGQVGYVSGNIIHLYHGKPSNRGYDDRYNVLKAMDFDPRIELEKSSNGLWKLKNSDLTSVLKSYFVSRNEDDNVIRVNDYFDKVYVLNLDRHVGKFDKIKKQLEDLEISFERFSAIDGNSISDAEYDFSAFKPGTGMLENKFALGCLRSHIEIIKDAKRRGFKRILVLEDDVNLKKNFEIFFQGVKKLNDWKLLYLGGSQYDWDVEFTDGFYKSKVTLGTFAFGIDSSIFNTILNENKERVAIDSVFAKIQKHHYGQCFTFYPNICIPDVSSSEIRGPRDQEEHAKKMRWNQ